MSGICANHAPVLLWHHVVSSMLGQAQMCRTTLLVWAQIHTAIQTRTRTCVRVTPLDRVVGMQQNTARPTASSGCRGRRRASRAARGVMARIDANPYRVAPQAERACAKK